MKLAGDADPAQVRAQKARLEAGVAREEAQGQVDVAQPLGEDEIYPVVPPETLKATVPAGGAAGGRDGGAAGGAGAGAMGGGEKDDAVSIIAQEEKGGDIQAAAGQARGEMAARRQEHATTDAQERASTDQDLARLEARRDALRRGGVHVLGATAPRRRAGGADTGVRRRDVDDGGRQRVRGAAVARPRHPERDHAAPKACSDGRSAKDL